MAHGWNVDYEGGQLRLTRSTTPAATAPPKGDPLAPKAPAAAPPGK